MSFIATITPLLKHGSSLSLNLKEVNGKIQIIIEPQLAKFDAETTDEVVATLQAALVHPIKLVAEPDATDQTLIHTLTMIAPVHVSTSDQLAEHQQRIIDAAAAAKAKAADKVAAKPAKAAPAKTTTKAASPASAATTTDDDDGDDTEGGQEASTDDTDAPVATPTAAESPAKASFELF